VLLAATLGIFAFTSLAQAAGEYEPNNSRGAPAGPFASGETISATIDVHDDSDWYKFYVADPDTQVQVDVTRTNSVNERFHAEIVENLHGDYIAAKSLLPGTNSATLTGTVGPGKYFAYVSGNPETDASGLTYSLTFGPGLSTFQAISARCTSATASLTGLTAKVASAKKAVTKAKKALAKAKKKKKAKARKALTKAKSKLKAAEAALAAAQAEADATCSVQE